MSACDLGYLIRLLNRNRIPYNLRQEIDGYWCITHNRTTFVYSLEGGALDVPDISRMMEIEMKDDEMAEAFFAGKLPAFEDELEAVREEGERIALYSQLRYLCLEEKWKPGWAAHFYKSLHGVWPDRSWEKVPPMRPTDEVYQLVARRQRSFRQVMKQRDAERRAGDERERGVEDSEVADALHEGDEGDDRVCDDRRVSGVEE